MSTRRIIPALPSIGLAIFIGTVAICVGIVREEARFPHLGDELPMISMLGIHSPERWWFSAGFTLVAFAMGTVIAVRARQFDSDPVVGAARGLRVANLASTALGVLAVLFFMVMIWVPLDLQGSPSDTQNFVHLAAALATFFFIFLFGAVHALSCLALWRRARPEPRRPGPMAVACMLACGGVVVGGVYFWMAHMSTLGQHVAVAACFGQFLPLSGALALSVQTPRAKASA